jgi:hypothetical protein
VRFNPKKRNKTMSMTLSSAANESPKFINDTIVKWGRFTDRNGYPVVVAETESGIEVMYTMTEIPDKTQSEGKKFTVGKARSRAALARLGICSPPEGPDDISKFKVNFSTPYPIARFQADDGEEWVLCRRGLEAMDGEVEL